jgi:hypothetical protein
MEMEDLSFNDILSEEEVENMFSDDGVVDNNDNGEDKNNDNKSNTSPNNTPEDKEDKENKDDKTTEVDVDNLFTDPESVGSGKNKKEEKEDTLSDKGNTSPNIFSSIAKAFKEEGIFPDLEDSEYEKVNNAAAFRDLVDQQIKAGLDERQKRIDEALNNNVEISEIKKYENALSYLESIDNKQLSDESEKGENLRKQLIYQDFINRGYSKERATREVQKSINASSDIEDAKEALNSNKEFFKENYDNLIKEAKEEKEAALKLQQEQANKLKDSILNSEKFFGDVVVDKNTRKKAFEAITQPVYKDSEGNYLTALQKYEAENKVEFLKNVSLLFTLTNGFKDINTLIKSKVNKEVKQGLKNLEQTLNNTSRNSDGSLRFVTNENDDDQSYFGNGLRLDI